MNKTPHHGFPYGWPLACVQLRFYALATGLFRRALLAGGGLVLVAGGGLGHGDGHVGRGVEVRAGSELGLDAVVAQPLRRAVLVLGERVSYAARGYRATEAA